MKYIILFLSILIVGNVYSQSTLPLRADTVLVEKTGGNAELKIRNSTRDSLGFLTNIGGGRTRFMRVRKINDTTIVFPPYGVGDTLNFGGSGGITTLIAKNGVYKDGDSIILGAPLDRYTYFQVNNNRRDSLSTQGANAILIGNELKDTSAYNYLFDNPASQEPYDKALLYLTKITGDLDTLYRVYGGTIQSLSRHQLSSTNTRHKDSSKPITMPYGGFDATVQLIPPSDTAVWTTGPFGGLSAFAGDLGVGGTTPYRLHMWNSMYHPYPFTVMRMGIDLARQSSAVKRYSTGNAYAAYTWDFRSHQANINAGSSELGSYNNKMVGVYLYGNTWNHAESPSKAKTLAVSTMDSVMPIYIAPQYLPLNETANGYSIVSDGPQDWAHFKGKFKVGGIRPYHNDGEQFQTVIDSTLKIGKQLSNGAFFTHYNIQNNITPSNIAQKKIRGFWTQSDYGFDQPTTINNTFIEAFTSRLFITADSAQEVAQNVFGNGLNGAAIGMFLRKRTGYLDTTVFQGASNAASPANALQVRFDAGQSGLASTRPNLLAGWHSIFAPHLSLNDWSYIKGPLIWLNVGTRSIIGTNNGVDSSYYMYLHPSDTKFTKSWAINQEGERDSVIFKGPTRTPNLPSAPSDTVNYKLMAVAANGVQYKIPWAYVIGASTSLPIDQVAFGAGGSIISVPRYKYTDSVTAATTGKFLATNFTRSGDSVYNSKGTVNGYFYGDSKTAALAGTNFMRPSTRIANAMNIIEVNRGIGGTRMVTLSAGDSSMQERTYTVPNYDGGWLFFAYGTNDWRSGSDTATYRAVYNSVIDDAIIKSWPLSKIVVISPGYSIHPTVGTQPRNLQFETITLDLAAKKGVKYVSIYEAMQLNGGANCLLTDSVHYNEWGAQVQALATIDTLGVKSGDVRANGYLYARQVYVKQFTNGGPLMTYVDSAGNEIASVRGWNGNQSFSASLSIGKDAMDSLTTGRNNYGFGQEVLRGLTTGNGNTAGGFRSQNKNKVGDFNTSWGYLAMSNFTGSNTTAVGAFALQNATSSTNSTALGFNSLLSTTTGISLTAVGAAAGSSNTTGGSSVFIGYNAGANNTTGNDHVYIGKDAGFGTTTNTGNVAIGMESQFSANNGTNTSIGKRSLQFHSGSSSTAIGHGANGSSSSAVRNVSIGFANMKLATTSSNNTSSGYNALDSIVAGSDNNTANGYEAALNLQAGKKNILIGHQAGLNYRNGDSSTIIGGYQFPTNTTVSKVVVLSDGSATATGVALYKTTDGKTGMGTVTPTQRLHVAGKVRIDSVDVASLGDSLLTIKNGVVGAVHPNDVARQVINAGTTDFTITVGALTVLPSLAGQANRTITIPAASSHTGKFIFLWNTNTDANLWSFGSSYSDPNGTTDTAIGNGSYSAYQSTGTVWLRIQNN